ncbi:MAG: hypothetical protein TECD_00877 [Hyphomicrobiaceae bacterium hypho_1]
MIDPKSCANLFTVTPDVSFLDVVAEAVLDGRLPNNIRCVPDTLQLSDWTILLPTRRAVRAMQHAFLKAIGTNKAILLPKLRPISQSEDETTIISLIESHKFGLSELQIPPAIDEFERYLVLMQMVQRWAKTFSSTDLTVTGMSDMTAFQVAHLALELADMMDVIEIENVSLDRLSDLVPESYSEHWQKTIEFLKIIADWWPKYLSASGCISPADRRNRIILEEANLLTMRPPKSPIIVAGVTGSIPATVSLIKAVYGLPNGAVIFPGLDRGLMDNDIQNILLYHPEHPQRGMLHVLKQIGANINDVQNLNYNRGVHSDAKIKLINEIFRPASTTSEWYSLPNRIALEKAESILDNITYLSAPNAQDEAEAIALILRHTAEQPGKTAALVTPNRILGRRVSTRLEAWGIKVDDSAGRPFSQTVPGTFLELVINAIAVDFKPCATMALLKHPLFRLGRTTPNVRRYTHIFELVALRTSYFGHGLDGLEKSLEKASQDVLNGCSRKRIAAKFSHKDWTETFKLIKDLKQAYTPLTRLFTSSESYSLREFSTAHLQTTENLVEIPRKVEANSEESISELWRCEAGEACALIFAGLTNSELPECKINSEDYPDFYRALVARETVRPHAPCHPRIFIWGPYEARLQQPDVIILGSLNEGIWPKTFDTGPWLNRSMLSDMGLPAPEEKIGYASHDFAQLLTIEKVYLTRSKINDGVPTVPSRWLMRIQAVISSLGLERALEAHQPWLAWARMRDAGRSHPRAQRPAPKPPLSLRPRTLSVSDVEKWIANPYAIFASHVLKLEVLPRLGCNPDASLRGTIIHRILGIYLKKFPLKPPANVALELIEIARLLFDEFRSDPRIAVFWIERFRRFTIWFAGEDLGLRGDCNESIGEISGAIVINTLGGPFTLKARADRIDSGPDHVVISDYKTATNLANLVVRANNGYSPQLLLEALIAERGGFAGLCSTHVSKLRYISAAGGNPPGSINVLKLSDVHTAIQKMEHELISLINRFNDAETPYLATRRSQFSYDFDDYSHLARITEWIGESFEAGSD